MSAALSVRLRDHPHPAPRIPRRPHPPSPRGTTRCPRDRPSPRPPHPLTGPLGGEWGKPPCAPPRISFAPESGAEEMPRARAAPPSRIPGWQRRRVTVPHSRAGCASPHPTRCEVPPAVEVYNFEHNEFTSSS